MEKHGYTSPQLRAVIQEKAIETSKIHRLDRRIFPSPRYEYTNSEPNPEPDTTLRLLRDFTPYEKVKKKPPR